MWGFLGTIIRDYLKTIGVYSYYSQHGSLNPQFPQHASLDPGISPIALLQTGHNCVRKPESNFTNFLSPIYLNFQFKIFKHLDFIENFKLKIENYFPL